MQIEHYLGKLTTNEVEEIEKVLDIVNEIGENRFEISLENEYPSLLIGVKDFGKIATLVYCPKRGQMFAIPDTQGNRYHSNITEIKRVVQIFLRNKGQFI